MNTCGIKLADLPEVPFINSLKEHYGNNSERLISNILLITNNEMSEFKSDFIEFYKTKYNTKINPVFKSNNASTIKRIVEASVAYINDKLPQVSNRENNSTASLDVHLHNYSATAARDEGKKFVSNIILNEFKRLRDGNLKIKGNQIKHYIAVAKSKWLNIIFDKAAKDSNKTIDEIKKEYETAEDKKDYINTILGGKNKSETNSNIYAVYLELNSNADHVFDYVNGLFNDPLLNKVLDDSSRDLDELQAEIEAESNGDLNQDSPFDVEGSLVDLDSSIANYDHSGIKKDFNSHVSDTIKIYFNTLPVLLSNSTTDYDTNNYFGLPVNMNAKECIQFMYSINEQFKDITSMIEAIKRASRNVKHFYAFTKFAQDLENDINFANEVFSTFAKPKYTSFEVRVNDTTTSVVASNPRVSAEASLVFDFISDIKSTAIGTEYDTMSKMVSELNSIIDDLKSDDLIIDDIDISDSNKLKSEKVFNDSKEKFITKITQVLKIYFPSIDKDAIRSYLELNNEAGSNNKEFINNCVSLLNDVKSTVESSVFTKQLWNKMQADLYAAREHNRKLDRVKATRTDVWVDKSSYIDENKILNDDFVDKQKTAIRSLVQKLLPYAHVNIRLNGRNINGNNQSAILNSSWLSHIKHMTETFYTDNEGRLRNDELEKWGEAKLLQNSQYKYSTLLVEQVDENGEVLNPGTALFRIVDGKVCITENADKVLNIMLFNGSSNIEDGTNMNYANMTKGDFSPTSYMMFFHTTDSLIKGLELATYFPKTPSDAPNAFGIRSVRHDVSDLLVMSDPEKVANEIDEMVRQTVSIIDGAIFARDYVNQREDLELVDHFVLVKNDSLRRLLTSNSDKLIHNTNAIRRTTPVGEDGTYQGYVSYLTKSGDIIVYSGTFGRKGRSTYLFNPTLVGVVNKNLDTNKTITDIPENIYNIFADNYRTRLDRGSVKVNDKYYNAIEYKINTDSAAFKMARNLFKQEMLDAAIAINQFFKLKRKRNGRYIVDRQKDKNGIWKPITKKDADLSRGYDNYHRKGKSVIEYNNSNLSFHLSGDVFHATNFTLTVRDKDGKLYTKRYFEHLINESLLNDSDGVINFLYGGGMELVCDNNGKVVDVVFSDKLLENVNEAMSDYLLDYIAQTQETVKANKKFIKNTPTDRTSIASYAVNNLFMSFACDHILDGSPKLYKSNQDVIKRVKQYQGSGTPYGCANYTALFTPNMNEAENSFLNNGFIENVVTEVVTTEKGTVRRVKKDENGKPIVERIAVRDVIDKYDALRGLRQRNGFYAVTIANTRRTNVKALEVLEKVLVDKAGLTSDKAKELLYGEVKYDKNGKPVMKDGMPVREGGFQDTKVNDAQSYITLEEFIRRLSAKGQLKRYLPLIEKLMDERKPLSADDITEFVQVQKNFYFDMWYDERYDLEVTRQIKNAEFVLIPRFIKGTQLARVYEAMKAAGIDQLNTRETSKAANEKVLRIWDDDANFDETVIEQFISEAQKERQIYSYNNLYTQQETPQHMDAENKAGIQFMKKILDNIPSKGHPLSDLKQAFFDTYCANIKDSHETLLKMLEIAIDKYGNIELNPDNTIKGINLKVLYEKLLNEARRTGVDDNQKDYFDVQEDTGRPAMPSYTNNYLSKFQSVFQSLFNSNITRQKLPGFHAAQVTNIGFKPYGEQLEVSYSKELQYHPNGEPYIQVIVPYKALGIDKNSKHYKNMSDVEILNELENKGLLEFIGYRIPTEGKQSMATMRIVGFIDDSLGSTIIVPDDWVSQTGSDFDIDSVYTVMYEHSVDKNGEISKIEYKENRTKEDWKKYIDNNKLNVSANASSKVKESIAKVKQLQKEILDANMEVEREAYDALPDKYKKLIKEINKLVDALQKNQDLNNYEAFVDRLQVIESRMSGHPLLSKVKELNDFYNTIKTLLNNLENKNDNYYNAVAKELGLLSLEDYLKPENDLIANTRKARNSRILDIAKSILGDITSLEENLSRSNFDKITKAKLAKMNPDVRTEREGRNPHNVNDQISYQEEVMSGRTLKGMSVALDTMCSVCNTVCPTLETPITVVYDSNSIDADIVNKAYDGKVNDKKKTITVSHNTYGWSKNNRNVVGDFITTYSSQTTAYILDAVKEGSIPNLNINTFPVFKTLANVGVDYGTILSFIMQPGISEIVRIQNSNNSVFDKGYDNEINDAIMNIAYKQGLTLPIKNDSISKVLKRINDKYKKELSSIFGIKDLSLGTTDTIIAKLPIISKLLDQRLEGSGKFKNKDSVNNALFDIATILIYSRLNRIAGRISSIASVCNPDKYGAKQSVYSTRKVFDKIDNILFDTEATWIDQPDGTTVHKKIKKAKKPILSVDGKHILEAIYPGISDENASKNEIIANIVKNNNVSDSKYPPLFAFLRYSTAVSTIIAKEVFDTENPVFTDVVEGLGRFFSGSNKELSEEAYTNFQRYLLTSMYKNIPSIKYRVHVTKKGDNVELSYTHTNDQNNPNVDDKVAAQKETSRIFGFGHSTTFEIYVDEEYTTKSGIKKVRSVPKTVEVKNINDPNKDEIADFEQLSPAQKVSFLKTHLADAGIFNLLQVNLFNSNIRGKLQNTQTIEYIDERTSSNEAYRLFKQAFESDNPLVVSTAIDLVKYSIQVEGSTMRATAINKIIDNDCLINDFNKNGLGIISDIRRQMREFGTLKSNYNGADAINDVYENYLRTLPDNVSIRTLYLSDNNKRKFNIYPIAYGILILKASNESKNAAENIDEFNKLLVKAGIKYNTISEEEYGLNSYIIINDPKSGVMLYKINDFRNNIVLTPLTKLEPNENSVWSFKDSNNRRYFSPHAYRKLMTEYAVDAANSEFNRAYINSALNKIKNETENVEDIQFVENKNTHKQKANAEFNIEDLASQDKGAAITLKEAIIRHFTNITSEPLYVDNILIGQNIYTPGIEYGSVQTIVFPNGDKHNFVISIPSNIDKLEKAFLNPPKNITRLNVEDIPYKTLKPIIQNHQDSNNIHMSNLGIVTEVDDSVLNEEEEVYSATVEDKISDAITLGETLFTISTPKTELFDITSKFKNNLYAYDITPDVESIKSNPLTSIREVSSFVIKTATYIREELFDRFIEDPNNEDLYIPITDPRVQDIIANDARYLDKYMQAVNLAKDFLEKMESLTNEVSEDPQFQSYINDIRRALADNLQNVPIDRLIEDLGNTLLKTKSTNPLVKQNFLKVMDGYYKTYGSMWQYHSIMENGTPILQVILSDVMTDLDAKEKAKHKVLKKYRDKLKEIQERATARGETININHIIDEDGNLISPYVQEFIDKLEELRTEMNKYAAGSKQHIMAKLAYDKFKAQHVNQEAEDAYYEEKIRIEEALMANIPDLYSKYMELFYRRSAIYDYARKEALSDDQLAELQTIEAEMYNLYRENEYIDEHGVLSLRPYIEPGRQYTPEQKHRLKLYSKQSAELLANSIKRLAELRDATFEQEAVRGFERTLNANLTLIERLERRVNGIPTVSQAVLAQNPDYVKAVAWVRENAYFSLNKEYNPNNEPVSLGAKLMNALHLLSRRGNGHANDPILKDKGIRDSKGVIDGRKLTDEQLASIKNNERYSLIDPRSSNSGHQLLDRILITNRRPDAVFFNESFYRRLASNGEINPQYYGIVTELNKLLAPYVGAIDGYVHFERVPDTAEGIEILTKIGNLYEELAKTDSRVNGTNSEELSQFIQTDVEIVNNEELFNQQVADVSTKSTEFKEAMLKILYVVDKNGEYRRDEHGKHLPNRFLYSYIKPKGNPGDRTYDRYVNSEEQQARALIDKYYEKVTTEYYEYAKEEALRNGTYAEWYEKNHFYNSYTRRMEPISCWVTNRLRTEYLADNTLEGKWMPKSKQANRKVKNGKITVEINGIQHEVDDPNNPDRRNHNYKPNSSLAENYKVGSGYDSGVQLNRSEREMLEFIKETLLGTARVNSAIRYFEKGKLPKQAKSNDSNTKTIIKEIGKSIGVGLSENNGYSSYRDDLGYGVDSAPNMPMLHDLDTKDTIELNKQLRELKNNKPEKDDNESLASYNNRLNDYEEQVKKLENEIRAKRREVLNTNWYDVIESYLSQAADYNAILDNKNKLYFLLNVLKDMKMYSRKYGSYGELAKERIKDDGTAIYKTSTDDKLLEQYKTFMRRILFNEWKESEGKLTSIGNFLQGYASANYMMLNIKGGFANVTLGETGILSEAAAKEYIGFKDWGFGTAEYTKGIVGYGASLYHLAATGKHKAFNKQGAVIDYCNVVDYDEVTGVIRNVDISYYSEQFRNFLFSPQSAGEHFMQNSVLFAMLHSHKIIETNQGIIPMNKNQYIAYKQYELLNEILTDEQREAFEEFKEKIQKNKDELAKYVWFRQDALTKFMYIECNDAQIKEFKARRKEQQSTLEAEFDAKSDIYSQLTMKEDGTMGFVAGSELDRLNSIKANTLGEVTEAELLMAKISEKTRHVNNKIHGVYNRLEAANIEKKWYGSLVMQYHKHIPMGLLKRYMARGHWNEFRSSVDKGMVQTMIDFASLNLEKVKKDCNFTEEESNALKSFVFQLTHAFKILAQMKATWEIIPEYERANMARNLGDLIGVVSAVATTAALWAIADDDDPDGYWFNFFLYEADRLSSEAFMYNPYGMINEGKKLMSTPVAAQSIITDAMNTIVNIAKYITDDDYDMTYQTGIHAGENRISVYVQRRIPIWSAIDGLIDLPDNNHVYKLGENAVSLINVKEKVRN